MSGLVNNVTDLPAEVDFIVVGTGAAGSVLAARLGEDPALTVLALEAGESLHGPEFTNLSSALGLQVPGSAWFWGDLTTPQAALGGRSLPVLSGRALGGGSAVNNMIWLRGNPVDYDGWVKAGADGWGWKTVRRSFDAIEQTDPSTGPDGASAPMAISTAAELDVFAQAFIAAGRNQGLAVLPYVGADGRDGIGPFRFNSVDDKRHSVVDGYLRPALERPNLTVATGSPVARLLTAGWAVTGVRLNDSTGRVVRARRSVVLAAGALRSPQLMMLSGIGPAGHLAQHGIAVVHDLPGVGANLQDHPAVPGMWSALEGVESSAGPGNEQQRLPASRVQAGALLRTTTDAPAPDIQLILTVIRTGPDGSTLPEPMVVGAPMLLAPHSRGTVRLASADPGAQPLVDPAYLADDRDRDILRNGLSWIRDLFDEPALRAVLGPPMMPAPGVVTRDALDAYLAEQVVSTNHPAGTCRMGTDAAAVVGTDLAVQGVTGLHVADASIMPSIIRGNTQATTIMIAERAARFLGEP
jgi:choline dehydrogenase